MGVLFFEHLLSEIFLGGVECCGAMVVECHPYRWASYFLPLTRVQQESN